MSKAAKPAVRAVSRGGALCASAAAALALTLALAGCGGAEPPAGPPPGAGPSGPVPLPPRPVELALNGLDPCALLTPSQRSTLGIPDGGSRADNSDLLGSNSCVWHGSALPPHGSASVTAVTKEGVEYFRSPPDQVIDISGFPALQARSEDADPEVHCLVLVDVAAGQTLWVQYHPDGAPAAGMTHAIACDRARETASAMVASLRAHLGR